MERRPWDYRSCRGLAGLSDEQWAVVAIGFAMAVGFGLGCSRMAMGGVLWSSLALGVLAGVFGDTVVFEGSAVGWIGTPICSALAALLGRFVRRAVMRATLRPLA
jgi:hypothetical protein